MLLDQIMPTYQFNTVHSTVIHAPAEKIFAAIIETRVSDVPLFNALFQIRSYPGYITSRGKGYFINNDMAILEQVFTRLGFIMLAEDPGREMVFGAIGRWWRLWGAEPYEVQDTDHFARFDTPGYAAVAGNFRVDLDDPSGETRLWHETRIFTFDQPTRRKFALYWLLIYPGATLLRNRWLKSIKKRSEEADITG